MNMMNMITIDMMLMAITTVMLVIFVLLCWVQVFKSCAKVGSELVGWLSQEAGSLVLSLCLFESSCLSDQVLRRASFGYFAESSFLRICRAQAQARAAGSRGKWDWIAETLDAPRPIPAQPFASKVSAAKQQ